MQRKLLFTTIIFVILLGACSPAATPEPTEAVIIEALTFTDGRGVEITLDSPAARIVSLAPSNTELLFAVGAGSQVVGRDAFSDFPEDALSVTDIGGGWGEIDTETLLTLEPDLILSADIIAAEQNEALEDLGLTVYVLPNPLELEDLYVNIDTVAALTGHSENAAKLNDELRGRVTTITEAVASADITPLVFYQLDSSDPSAPWTSGPGTFIDTLIEMAGGQNVGASLEDAWAQISAEALIDQNPDVILMGDAVWSGLTADDIAARPGWDAIAAVQNSQVFAFDDNLVSRPGPRMIEGLETLAIILHPDLLK
jgi:iron complex transport system substrate-binding protein